MHTRQGGAAQLNILFLMVMLVFFAGSVFFCYTMLVEKADREGRLANARSAVEIVRGRQLLFQHYSEDLAAVLKMSGSYQGRPNIPSEDYMPRSSIDRRAAELAQLAAKLETLAAAEADTKKASWLRKEAALLKSRSEDFRPSLHGIPAPAAVGKAMSDFMDSMSLASSSEGLTGLTAAVKRHLDQLESQGAALITAANAALTSRGQADQDLANADNSHRTSMQAIAQGMEQARSSFASDTNVRNANFDNVLTGLKNKNDELHAEKVAHVGDVKRLEGERARLAAQKMALEGVLGQRNNPSAPDGSVIVADQGLARGYIDLGRDDNLISGTVFRITNPRSNAVKAYGTVVKIGESRSEIAISGLVDRHDPVSAGDRVSNDRFTPGMKRTICLMGRFGLPWDRNTVTSILKGLGNDVVKKFDVGVDLVVIGDILDPGLVEIAQYKDAMELGAEFAPVHRLRDLLRLGND